MTLTFGVDLHPQYQEGISVERIAALGYKFAFVKISEGPYRDGSVWSHPNWKPFALAARRSGMFPGFYHFLVNSHPNDHARGGRVQAELYWNRLKQVGGPKDAALIVDFEHYSDKYPWLSPHNATLKAFVRRLKELSDGQPVVVYTTESYWKSGVPTGPLDDYDLDFLWEARYPHMNPIDNPKDYFQKQLSNWQTPWQGLGGAKTSIIQFTPAGLVAGRYIDVNASRWRMNHIRAMGVKPLPNENETGHVSDPSPPRDTLDRNIERVLRYGRECASAGIKYWCWDNGNLNVPRPGIGRPASVDGRAPDPNRVRRGFCADLVSWQLRLLGKPIPKNRFGNENYDGGTRAFRFRYASQMKPLKLSEVRKGDVLFVDFQTRWAPEGHIAVCEGDGPDALVQQSHLDTTCSTGEPGFNRRYTVRESNSGDYYTHRIPRGALWG